jgi:hypothetical protein
LHPHALEREPQLIGLRQQAGVDQRRLAGARVAVEQDAAIDRDEARQPACLLLACEEDRMVDEAKRLDAPVRNRRDRSGAFVDGGYGSSSSPRTSA